MSRTATNVPGTYKLSRDGAMAPSGEKARLLLKDTQRLAACLASQQSRSLDKRWSFADKRTKNNTLEVLRENLSVLKDVIEASQNECQLAPSLSSFRVPALACRRATGETPASPTSLTKASIAFLLNDDGASSDAANNVSDCIVTIKEELPANTGLQRRRRRVVQWTPEEDMKLLEGLNRFIRRDGRPSYVLISRSMGTKTPGQVRNRRDRFQRQNRFGRELHVAMLP